MVFAEFGLVVLDVKAEVAEVSKMPFDILLSLLLGSSLMSSKGRPTHICGTFFQHACAGLSRD